MEIAERDKEMKETVRKFKERFPNIPRACECGCLPMAHRGILEICILVGCNCTGYRSV